MPLRDHFRPPVSDRHSWEELHGQWPAWIVGQLRNELPHGFVAKPRVHLGTFMEIDVATYEPDEPYSDVSSNDVQGGVATAVWAPAKPSIVVETDLPDLDEYEVRIYDDSHQRRLVAAIELVSPSNKDRPETRRMFISKCAALIQQGVAVSIVDLVTARKANLYVELLEMLGESDPTMGDEPPSIYASSTRWITRGRRKMLESWSNVLNVGQPLPTIPLWLTDDLSIPLNLETSYERACHDLWIE